MTEQCEILQETALSNSSIIPATSLTVNEVASASSEIITESTVDHTSIATGLSFVDSKSYTTIIERGTGSSYILTDVDRIVDIVETARGTSTVFVGLFADIVDTGYCEAQADAPLPPYLLISTATVISSVVVNSVSQVTVEELGTASSFVFTGDNIDIVEVITGISEVLVQRAVLTDVSDEARSTDYTSESGEPSSPFITEEGSASSSVFIQVNTFELVGCTAEATDSVFYYNPDRIAWVLNTESSAVSWYENYDFNSIVQTPDGVFACSDEGLFIISGETDLGDPITASLKTGFMDFGNPYTKRVENIYFGYKSPGQIATQLEVYGSNYGPYTYYLEPRPAQAPRNSRVVPGKGLVGRYWRITVFNVEGVDFVVEDSFIDIAISSRRV